ncbi:MAG: NAD(P)/FAD-dependent oxidoreductase [Candidatus Thermoplasmatota archaeon]|nr:NAD(P)/FAD-dependent oxidoreductase [Candidatus Thermoplasmatota archaeon]
MLEDLDVLIIGAGPVGGHTAELIAKAGFSVAIVEEHREVGEPVQCGGIFTPRVMDLVDCWNTVLERIRGCEFYSPSGKELVLDGGKTAALVVDRAAFDREVVRKALQKGATCHLGALATGVQRADGGLSVRVLMGGIEEEIRCRIIIGADGVKGNVTKWFHLARPYRVLPGFEAEVVGAEHTPGYVKVFIGRKVAPGFFAWLVPSGGTARAGLCLSQGNARAYLERMFLQGPPASFLSGAKPVGYIIGGIPIGLARRTYSDNVMVVGDAAFQAKATSGGGIYTGLVCAEHCALTAIEALEAGDLSASFLARYEERWKKDIGRELKRYLFLHKVLSRLNDKQMEEIHKILNRPRLLTTISELGDIDYQWRVVLGLLKQEPRLLRYVGSAIRALL